MYEIPDVEAHSTSEELPDSILTHLRWRLDGHGIRIKKIEDEALKLSQRTLREIEAYPPPILDERIKTLREDLSDVEEEVKGLRRALYTLAISITSAAVIFAFSVAELIR